MVSGPEVARLINEFETSVDNQKQEQSKGPDMRHHEQQRSYQVRLQVNVKCLADKIHDMGNPFLDNSSDLYVLDSRVVVDDSVSETLRQEELIGKQQ